MKKLLFLLSLALSLCANAQYQAQHVLEVKNFTNWAPDYLTVTNNWNNMCLTPLTTSLKCLSVIMSINGQSTKGMDEETFYSILDSSPSFDLTYQTKLNGENLTYSKHFTKKKGKLLITPLNSTEKPETVSLLSDNDIDFFSINTFDYRLGGDDQLMDKTLMEIFADRLRSKGLKRVTDKPDIYLYITKDVNQKIESVYVPEYTTTTNTGSTGVGITNFLGVKGLNVGSDEGSATTVTRDNGHVRTDVNADAYLEFSILDARKLDNKSAPIIWQLTYSEHKNTEIRLLEAVKKWIGSWAVEYPFHEPVVGFGAVTWGLFSENFQKDAVVSDVVEGSLAQQSGCKVGDQIKYVRYSDDGDNSCTFRPGQSFYAKRIISTTSTIQVGKNMFNKGGVSETVKYDFIINK